MSPLHSRRAFTDRLLAKLTAEPRDRPVAGDFAAVCTDLAADTWELFPIALAMTDGSVLQLRDERGGLLAFDSVSERSQPVVTPANAPARPRGRARLVLAPVRRPRRPAHAPGQDLGGEPMTASQDVLNVSAQTRLRSIVERIERLEEDKAAVAGDIKEVFAEAKGEGYDAKILRKVVRLRKMDKAKRQEEEALLDLYMAAIEGDAASPTPPAASAAELPKPKGQTTSKTRKGACVAVDTQWRTDQHAPPSDAVQVYGAGSRRGFR
jgi:uncharacterized protein (UPF0335 family)